MVPTQKEASLFHARKLKDVLAKQAMFLSGSLVLGLIFLLFSGLFQKASTIIASKGLSAILFSSTWRPTEGQFGLGIFIAGTFWVTAIALIIAIPIGILTALFLSEYSTKRIQNFFKPIIDLLAGISPVIFGVWGILAVVPFVREVLIPSLGKLPFFPFVSDNFTGYCVLSGGIVLAIMILPIIISIIWEVMSCLPKELRHASLALGATKWQTTKYVVLKKSLPGITAAIVLGLARALGETIAVLMVAGCSLDKIPNSIFDTGYPLPAFIANTYGEMMSIPLYDSAVMLAAFILLSLTVVFNMFGWGILLYVQRNEV